MKNNTVHRIAFKDISKYLSEQNIQIRDEHGDVWVVTPKRMYCKEQKRLNRQLGINKVNHYGNTNGKCKCQRNEKPPNKNKIFKHQKQTL